MTLAKYLSALLALILSVAACSTKNDTDVIRDMMKTSAAMAESKQVGELMQLTGQGFVAMPGRRDAEEVKGILLAAFMHYGKIKIHFPKPSVEISPEGDRASARVYFLIVRQDQPLPGLKELYEHPRQWLDEAGEKADLYQLKLILVKQQDAWVVMEANLDRFRGVGF